LKISTFGLGRGGEGVGEAFLGFGGWMRGFGCDFFYPEGWMGWWFRKFTILFLFFS
jgi:hypothetical protein